MKIIKFATPKGECYIPLKFIANHRAKYYSTVDNYGKDSDEWNEQVDFILNDNYEGIDWMENNMNWEDFSDHVVMLNDKVMVTDEDRWENSDKNIEEIDTKLADIINDSERSYIESKRALEKFGISSIIPNECPICLNQLVIKENSSSGSVGLYCVNDICAGAAVKKLQKGVEQLGIKGIGLSTCEKLFEAKIERVEDLFDKTKFNRMKLIDSGHFKSGKSLEIIVNAVDKTDSLELKRIVNSLNITDVGSSVSEQIARMLAGLEPDFGGLNKDAIARMQDKTHDDRIRLDKYIEIIKDNNIDIIEPKELSSDVIKFEMTGDTKPYFKQKRDFADSVFDHGYIHHKLNKECDILITNDLESNTGKMKKARQLGKEIKTYKQIAEDLGLN